MKDEDIIGLFFQRSEEAIFQTQQKYGAYCFVVANGILRNRETSEECLNDTWLETWNVIPPRKPNMLKLFLAKITRNLALDRYRQQRAQKRGGGQIPLIIEELEDLIPARDNVEDALNYRSLVKDINDFVLGLSDEEKAIFLQRYFYANLLEEIAQAHRMTTNTLAVKLYRIRKALAAYLEERGYVI